MVELVASIFFTILALNNVEPTYKKIIVWQKSWEQDLNPGLVPQSNGTLGMI